MAEITEMNVDPLLMARLDRVTKKFDLKHTRSIKEYVVWWLTGRRGQLSETFNALDEVTFDIHQGESVALLGFNGSGKSTTLKMVSGVLQPDRGIVQIRGRVAGLIEVGAGMHPDLTGRENIFLNAAILGLSEKEIQDRFDSIVKFSEIEKFIDTEVKFYSSGMYMRDSRFLSPSTLTQTSFSLTRFLQSGMSHSSANVSKKCTSCVSSTRR